MKHDALRFGALIITMLLMGCHDDSERTRSATSGHSWNSKVVDYTQFKRLMETFYTDAAWAPPGPDWRYFDVVVEWVDGTKEGKKNLGESFIDAIGRVNIDIQAKVAVLENEMDKRMSYPDDAFSQAWLRFDAAVRMVYYAIKTPFSADRMSLIDGARNLLLRVSDNSPSAFHQFTDWFRACKKRREADESLGATPCNFQAATILEARLILKQLKSLLTRMEHDTFKAVSHSILDGLVKSSSSELSTPNKSLNKQYDVYLSALKTLLKPPPQHERLESLVRNLVRKISMNKLNVD